MKKIIPKLLLAFLFLTIISTVFGAGKCAEHEEGTHDWVPTNWSEPLSIDYYEDYVITYQTFSWNETNLDNFLDRFAHYQYEIRRQGDANRHGETKEAWDYWKLTEPFFCEGVYFTNLPNPIEDVWSEEADLWFLGCLNLLRHIPPAVPIPDDEEFQLKSLAREEIVPSKEYYVTGKLWRDFEDIGKDMNIWSESEYCNVAPYCAGNLRKDDFHWCEMTSERIRA
ncbi:MAG: hypothetical protein Q7K34_01070 [archaeon]|nr:hypothetical protein [archaeon]